MSAFDAYIQAAFHGGTMAGGPTFTVVHDAETPLRAGYADSIAEFFRRGPTAGTSAHAMVDPVKAIKMLPDNVVAWAAGPKANPRGWHLEQAGYASFTLAQWTTADGLAQMRRAGACLREVHDTWGIPKRWCTDDQLRRAALGDRASGGMTTHHQISRVLGGTTHTDPEPNYPKDLLLQAVVGGSPAPAPAPNLGDTDMRTLRTPDGTIWLATDTEVAPIGSPGLAGGIALARAADKVWGGTVAISAEDLVALRDDADARRARRADEIAVAAAKLVGTPDVDEAAIVAGLTGALSGRAGLSSADVEAAVRNVLREGTGDPVAG